MLTLEQYRDPDLSKLYQNYLATGPLNYMSAIFRKMTNSDEMAKQLALEFYGPIFFLYSVYDAADNKAQVFDMLETHIERFIAQIELIRGKTVENIVEEK